MEVLQSLVLLTEGTPFIIFLAIDQRVVVTAIENSGEGLYNDAGVNGHENLDKIVQIPFVIPQLADDEKAKLCKGYLKPAPPQRPLNEGGYYFAGRRRRFGPTLGWLGGN